jgi:RNA polymerase sigma-54 factor
MALRQRVEFRQKPIFSQSLQMSVKILELPLLELKEAMDKEIGENPVLEEIAPAASPEAPPEASGVVAQRDEGPEPEPSGNFSQEYEDYEKPVAAKADTLADFLMRQLRINAADEEQLRIGTNLIDHIDDNGYCHVDLAALSHELGASAEAMAETLKLIQTFDPPGIAASDIKQCLLIQLKRLNDDDPLTRALIQDHLENLPEQDPAWLCKKLKCTADELAASLKKIHRLEPKPGRGFTSEEIAYVIPDVTIELKDDILTVATKDDALPTIRVSQAYKTMLRSKTVDEKTKDFIREKIRNATALMQAIANRRKTLLVISRLIAETQEEALREGLEKLKPLTLKEIAEKAGLHESTVSRIVMHKYAATPVGIFPLKDFFSTALKMDDGTDVSSQKIKMKISEIVDNEDKTKPLKDHEIARMIQESENTPLARRTIAKYREMTGIPPASQRRKKNNLAPNNRTSIDPPPTS